MAPKRPSRRQGFRRDAIKRPRSNADASTKKDDSARLKNTPGRELYSPNINSSEFSDLTEDGDEELADLPKSTSTDGKTPRQIRAARRAAERRFDDLTDSDEEPGESVKAGNQGPPEGVDLISNAGAKGQAVEEQPPSHAEAESENSPEKGPGLDLIGDDEVVEEEPAENIEAEAEESPEVESDSNADAEGDDAQAALAVANDEVESQESTEETPLDPNVDADEDDNEEPSVNEEEEDQAVSADITPEPEKGAKDKARIPVGLQGIDLTQGAAARYIEAMTRIGHRPSWAPGAASPSPSSSSSSSSSDDSELAAQSDDQLDGNHWAGAAGYVEYSEVAPMKGYDEVNDINKDGPWNNYGYDDDALPVPLGHADHADVPAVEGEHWNRGEASINQENRSDNDDGDGDGDDDYLVYRRNKVVDSMMSGHLRRIGRALNFLVRAKASGIEIGRDLDSLAAVSPEQWEELVDAPDNAAELVVKKLLDLSIWDISILAERALELRNDLRELGIEFE